MIHLPTRFQTVQLHIGIDDTDSEKGGCTTYVAARLVAKLAAVTGIRFRDYPNIIRLNPNVPFKTRGNAAVALRITARSSLCEQILDTVLHEIENHSHIGRTGTDPAIVMTRGRPSREIVRFSRRALHDLLSAEEAVDLVRATGATAACYGTDLGLVGALAAVGQTLAHDHTFELIAYRTKSNWGSPRRVDEDSVIRMDRLTRPMTFNNYDFENKRVLIAPHGPDPILFGIRGESAEVVRKAFRYVKAREPIERWVIFRTNHGTDAHLESLPENPVLGVNRPTVLRGTVGSHPKRIRGGHVFFELGAAGRDFTCAAYEPTGNFRETAANLARGDEVTVYGSLRESPIPGALTVNLEKMRIHHLIEVARRRNPICPSCGKRLKSGGRGQGYKCEKCSFETRTAEKQTARTPRSIATGIYLPTAKAHRHLTKPASRYGMENAWNGRAPDGCWHYP